ncbi:sugar-transfer associated ATP-grasp domain-containing protein [Spartinivicinus ruber]|uniref:sugar-transfer associated ATP-grasp domain-containing protein n=1 Tax=Spartinivicinus ruber TaxID=2683272 RepID=UPI0013D561DE|nr:sugar-transfer associated ATP-grasp domain-containing protein [Spartinivicinus ruber]
MISVKGSLLSRLQQTIVLFRQEAHITQKPLLSLLTDALHIYFSHGIGPNYYLLAGMARNDFPSQQRDAHLSSKEYTAVLDILNPPEYRKLTQSKLNEKALYQFLKIPTAAFIGYYHPTKGFDTDDNPLTTFEQFRQLLVSNLDNTLCFKPIEGWGGHGFIACHIKVVNGEIKLKKIFSEKEFTIEEFTQYLTNNISKTDLLIEKYIQQSTAYAKYNDSSLNTVRVWVLESREIEVIGAYFRVGRVGSQVDNGDSGGIMCPVNIDTGEIQPGLITNTPVRNNFSSHPDNGTLLAGYILDRWHEIVTFSCEVLRKLPNLQFAGLDIAMTENGPVLVETNVCPDKDGAAFARIPSIKCKLAIDR